MASYDTPCEIARAWLLGKSPTKRLKTMYAGTIYRDGEQRPALFSYGDHYVVAFMQPDRSVALNEHDYSRTTGRHVTATAIELRTWGYNPTDDTFSGPNGHVFRAYRAA